VKERKSIDVSDRPELRQLAEEVHDTKVTRVLRTNGQDLAMVIPIPTASQRPKAGPAYEAFRSAAGGWRDVDTEKLLRDIYRSRDISIRPPPNL